MCVCVCVRVYVFVIVVRACVREIFGVDFRKRIDALLKSAI